MFHNKRRNEGKSPTHELMIRNEILRIIRQDMNNNKNPRHF